ncbi:MAG: HAD-IIA family hydrolase [Ruthenibacterium sp.]
MQTIRDTKLFLLDMDGTFYLGDTLLPGARAFLQACEDKQIAYTFLTNNSSRSKTDYLAKLAHLGVSVTEREMFTSGDATLLYLAEHCFDRNILLIGTPSLEAQFSAAGYIVRADAPQAVVLGFDTTLTYEKLTALCNAVRAGLPYIATHPDFNCPVPGGFIPDIGAVIAFVKASTGREPDAVIGKPNRFIAQAAAQRFGVPLSQVCMVGDRLYTDIALGTCGCMTALVLCGESTRTDLAASGLVPTVVCADLSALRALL